jgi:hypothetical protein
MKKDGNNEGNNDPDDFSRSIVQRGGRWNLYFLGHEGFDMKTEF